MPSILRKRRKRKLLPPKTYLKRSSKKKSFRQEEIKKRKNIIPSFLITILLWLIVILVIFFVDPLDQGAVQMFFGIFLITLIFSFSLLLSNTRRGLIISISVIMFLILRYLGIGNILNLLLMSGLAISLEIYFSKK